MRKKCVQLRGKEYPLAPLFVNWWYMFYEGRRGIRSEQTEYHVLIGSIDSS